MEDVYSQHSFSVARSKVDASIQCGYTWSFIFAFARKLLIKLLHSTLSGDAQHSFSVVWSEIDASVRCGYTSSSSSSIFLSARKL